jgi:hypothetical protein
MRTLTSVTIVCLISLAAAIFQPAAADFSTSSLSGPYVCAGNSFASTRGKANWIPSAFAAQIVGDGKGGFSSGKFVSNTAGVICSYTLTNGSYTVNADGTGTGSSTWKSAADNPAKSRVFVAVPSCRTLTRFMSSEPIATGPARSSVTDRVHNRGNRVVGIERGRATL